MLNLVFVSLLLCVSYNIVVFVLFRMHVVCIKGSEQDKVTYKVWLLNNETALAISDLHR